MFTLYVVCVVAVFIGLVIVTAVRPARSTLSLFELRRRAKKDDTAQYELTRTMYVNDIASLLAVLRGLLLVVFVLAAVGAFGWVLGVIIAIVGALQYESLARFPAVRRIADRLYGRIEPKIIRFMTKQQRFFAIIRGLPVYDIVDPKLDSKEQLTHLVEGAGTTLSPDEKLLIKSGLQFGDRQVSSVMTPRSVIDAVDADEVLGPLSLDQLHKTGHNRFPVIEKDIDHVVGIVYIRNLLSLSDKKTKSARDVMSTPVFYIKDSQTLQHALAAFLRTKHHLFIVVNEYRETVGIITLEDVLESLIGRKIVDEFDAHEDLRKVAARNPRKNNHPPSRTDV